MQYKTVLSALLVGLAFTGEVTAQRHRHRGGEDGQRGGFNGAKTSAVAAASATAASSAASVAATPTDVPTATTGNNGNQGKEGGKGKGGGNALALDPQAVQSGSDQDGSKASGSQSGQVASATDAANFINFCAGKTLTNGLQVKGGSCNGIVMGDIPSNEKMVSTVITNPSNGDDITPNETFKFSASTINMIFGHFTNAQATYYSAPQTLDPATGQIIGHTHFTVQAMTDANTKTPLDPKTFAFFKGVNDAGDGKGDISATVTGGLPAGIYRVCTMTSASNHQPVLMPVAQRGPQDDCIRFTVGQGSGNAGAGGNNGTDTSGAAGAASSSAAAASASDTATATETGAAAGATETGAAADTGKRVGGKKGKGMKGKGTKKGKGAKKGEKTGSAAAPKATGATGKSKSSGCDKKKGKRAVHVQW